MSLKFKDENAQKLADIFGVGLADKHIGKDRGGLIVFSGLNTETQKSTVRARLDGWSVRHHTGRLKELKDEREDYHGSINQ